jgi:superfamily II DNA/RNA helicase
MNSFDALGVSQRTQRALAARGIHAAFPIQALVLPHLLAGHDALVKSPTGSGKTLAFAVPIVERVDTTAPSPAALVLVPTRELATQVAAELEAVGRPHGVRVATVYGGVPVGAQVSRARRAHAVVATPGRLNDLVARGAVDLRRVRMLVLDEADRMLDMGFQPQVDRIVDRLPRRRQTMFFSATLDGRVGELAHGYTSNAKTFAAAAGPQGRSGEVEHRFVEVDAGGKVAALAGLLAGADGLTLVFVRTRRGADRLVKALGRHDVSAVAMHGDMSQGQRERALRRFESGAAPTLVATDVAARGLDVDDITHVVNFDPPVEQDAYVHRVGRTGRAGRSGVGTTLVLPEQRTAVGQVASALGHDHPFPRPAPVPRRPDRSVRRSRRPSRAA